ncbi:copper-binding protein [Burkholderiaceae bacterium FT117]|uniref:copper-binding protein n=1 Tax=Zeimonas sediminis TaxID=2944268 RepID=UPI002342C26B|nr:copper-binding protein [Zeimonas sediminis]MCM5570676.1 copper-binding protein [Zeimonas sediminis]
MNRLVSRAPALAVAAALAVPGAAFPAQASPPDPSAGHSGVASPLDPAATSTAPAREGLAGAYRPLPSLDPLPWRKLFDERGAFVDHGAPASPAPAAARQASMPGHAPMPGHAATPGQAAGAGVLASADGGDTAPAGADAVATVLRIDREAKRVRLKHGPIRKLEMPGMTMLFQVADPALLDAVSVGDTVGFKVEQRGQAFVVTEWVREGAK